MGRKNFLLGLLPLFALGGFLSSEGIPPVLTAALVLPLIWVAVGLFLKRLRDAGFTPLLVLIGVIPFLGWIALAILSALPGKGSAGAPVWKSFVAGLSALMVLVVLGGAILPTEEPVGEDRAEVSSSEVVEEAELQGVDSLEPGSAEDQVSEADTDVTGSVEEEAAAEAAEAAAEAAAEEEAAERAAEAEPAPVAPEPAPEVAPPPVEASGFEARIAQLRVEPEFPSGYDRDLFGGWRDADGDGCNTRWEVLIAESLTPVSVGAGCSVSGGQWYSAFDGVTTTDPSSFDVDHFVPLKEAWDSGAHAWSSDQRRRFANDLDYPGSLMAVTASSNRSKGAGDPAEWLPMPSYRCEYVRTWVEVKLRWNLSADSAEVSAIRSLGC
jgi:uncharacterized membrane protein YhaH (DUF805 family)